ncbi:hypothetical protein H257_18935 [Aphanomyces astaci]|uniref:Uncharacterized protein n=1 Tax=Aphanomyces astaci TaxID=112090 RepID=W4F9K8_APHAT|nr:hypothetical protein H257_18935 [Aphanomyces astaci]ETV64137.1 hypothetical protein H257_18935 [Aphanomyces astaci]|eukprot:XP_009846384.1 hypothetical protein H257_18935 [Aphanomyces astaci]
MAAFTIQSRRVRRWSTRLRHCSFSEGAWFNLGQSPFQYQPPRGYISVLESVNATSSKEGVPLPRVDVYSHRHN